MPSGPTPSPLQNYDPNQVYTSFNGVNLSGFLAESFIKVTRNKDMFTYKGDISGSGTRSKTNDRSGIIELTLTQRSASNQLLSGFAIADENTGAATGVFMIKDALGSDLVVCQTAWVIKMPDIDYAIESGSRVWRFETDVMTWNLGN